jgi:hypothetical protein
LYTNYFFFGLCADGTQDQVQSRRRSQRASLAHTSWRISKIFELDREGSDSNKEGDISDNEIDNSRDKDNDHGKKRVQADDPQPPKPDVYPSPIHTSASEHIIDLTIEENLLDRISDLEEALSSTKQELSAALEGISSALEMGAALYRILLKEPALIAGSLPGGRDPRVLQAIQDMGAAGLKHDWEEAVRKSGDGGKI